MRTWLAMLVAVSGAALGAGLSPPGGGGAGLTVRDLERVEAGRGDRGGLATSLARGPASLAVPSDFGGVFRIPEDADTPYAGWFARVQGGTIAVFPRGEYVAGGSAVIPANTRFFFGRIPTGAGPGRIERARAFEPVVDRGVERVDGRAGVVRPSGIGSLTRGGSISGLARDAAPPETVSTARDAAGVQRAMEKLCSDGTYRAWRVADLLSGV